MTSLRTFTAVCALCAGTMGSAAPIELIWSSLDASGTLDGKDFGASEVIVRAIGDTDDVTNAGFLALPNLAPVTVELVGSGLPTLTAANPMRAFNNVNIIGFQTTGRDLIDFRDGGTLTYDFLASVGPLGGTIEYLQWAGANFITDQGVLVFDNSTVRGTFEAIVGTSSADVPLPASLPMLLAGLGGFAWMRRKV